MSGECLLIDPQSMVRRGLALLLQGMKPGFAVHEASDLGAVAALAGLRRFDLVMVDAGALAKDGLRELSGLVRAFAGSAVIVTSSGCSGSFARACLSAGARGFVAKSDPSAVLELVADLMRRRTGGGTGDGAGDAVDYIQVPRAAVRDDFSLPVPVAQNAVAAMESLTPRQREVFLLLQAGCSNKEIARQLGVLEGTVKVHVRAVMARLGLRNRTQVAILAARAIQAGDP